VSDSPKTDAAVEWATFRPGPISSIAEFARSLERENAALRKDKERLDLLASRYWAVPVTKEYTDHIWMIDHDTPDLRAAIDARAKEANQ
jgi:hypothetical protein